MSNDIQATITTNVDAAIEGLEKLGTKAREVAGHIQGLSKAHQGGGGQSFNANTRESTEEVSRLSKVLSLIGGPYGEVLRKVHEVSEAHGRFGMALAGVGAVAAAAGIAMEAYNASIEKQIALEERATETANQLREAQQKGEASRSAHAEAGFKDAGLIGKEMAVGGQAMEDKAEKYAKFYGLPLSDVRQGMLDGFRASRGNKDILNNIYQYAGIFAQTHAGSYTDAMKLATDSPMILGALASGNRSQAVAFGMDASSGAPPGTTSVDKMWNTRDAAMKDGFLSNVADRNRQENTNLGYDEYRAEHGQWKKAEDLKLTESSQPVVVAVAEVTKKLEEMRLADKDAADKENIIMARLADMIAAAGFGKESRTSQYIDNTSAGVYDPAAKQ
jgi:hypothetical protein